MYRNLKLLPVLFLCTVMVFAQKPIDVTDQTIKVGGLTEEGLYFVFAEGDKIILNFQELKNKELKEVEIVEYPSSSKFSDYKSKKIENKTIEVTKQGVYIFRFKNSALGGRICKIKIQRIPASDATADFNTAVAWVTKQDTTWNTYTKDVVIGYDTIYEQRVKKDLVKVDTLVIPVFDKSLRVHSGLSGQTQYTNAMVELPKNTYDPNQLNPYSAKEVISWSYWLGVGQKAEEEYEKANKSLSSSITTLGAVTGYPALASLAVTGLSLIGLTQKGENVHYKFYGAQNEQEIVIDYGNVVSAAARNEKIMQGAFNVQLYNDNVMEGIDVNLKIVALQLLKVWRDVSYTEQIIVPRTEKQLFKEPIVNTRRVPVISDY